MTTDAGSRTVSEAWTRSGPVLSSLPRDEIDTVGSRAIASVATPAAFSLFGFATGTWIAGVVVAGLFGGHGSLPAVAPILIVFAGIAQFIGGLVALRRDNAFAGTAFCAYGANNTVLGLFFVLQAARVLPMGGAADAIIGLELLSFALVSAALSLAAGATNLTFVTILALLVPGFALAGIADIGGPSLLAVIGGWFLFASAIVAYYAASALVVNSAWQRPLLPLFGRA